MSMDIKPHAYDPMLNPELFEGVLARRVLAFFIDFLVISIPVVLAAMFIFAFGIVTLGFGWAIYWLLPPASVVWAIVYFGATLGGDRSATIGMRVMELEMRTWYGAPAYFVLGAVHAIAFWFTVSCSRPSSCWSPFSTSAAACCTISCSAPSLSTIRSAPPSCGLWSPLADKAQAARLWRNMRHRAIPGPIRPFDGTGAPRNACDLES